MTVAGGSVIFPALMGNPKRPTTASRFRVGGGPGGVAALVLGLIGVFGLFTVFYAPLFMVFSVAAWSIGEREVQKFKALGVPVEGLGTARAGHVLGVIGVALGALIAGLIMLAIGAIAVSAAAKGGFAYQLLTEI